MKRYVILSACAMMTMMAAAQETYESARFAETDLNGTARYVGMGGAMEALGADISTISTNPAGIGLFKHSKISGSFGVVSQSDAESFSIGNKTNMSLDQVGFVYAMQNGRQSWLNFSFNYSKSKNFNHILKAAGELNGSSQNKLSAIKDIRGGVENYGYDVDYNQSGKIIGYENLKSDGKAYNYNQVDYLYWNCGPLARWDGDNNTKEWSWEEADSYLMQRANTGYIGRYDFNLSGNINNRVFLGVTFGLSDVHYKNYSEYTEQLVYDGENVGTATIADDRRITGTGFDVKAGIIFRPIDDSPFRIGASVSTPTWYTLTTDNYTTLNYNGKTEWCEDAYDFRLNTPWKFGLSLGHTIDNYIALGLSYEYADMGALDNRVKDYANSYYDYSDSYSDELMNSHTKNVLRGTHTLKIGGELKPTPELAVRLGYNYISPSYKKDGFKDLCLNSYGSYFASATDYTNWKSTNRITAGLGYTLGGWGFDLAYQYSQTNGDFYPFSNYEGVTYKDETIENTCSATSVSNKRHQLLFTIGYTF